MPAVLADTTKVLLDSFPPFMQDSYDVQAVMDVAARELDRFESAKDQVVLNFFPQTSDLLLVFYELMLGLGGAAAKTTAQRRTSVLAFLQKISSSGSGLSWEANVSALIGSAWSYAEHNPADGSSPPANTIKVTLPFSGPIGAPTGLVATPSGSGGTLTAATYHYEVTAVNAYGETPPSASVPAVTSGTTSSVGLAWTAVVGAASYNVYRGTGAGALMIEANVGTNSYTDTGAVTPGGGSPPVADTTASVQTYEAGLLLRAITPAHLFLTFGYGAGFIVGISRMGDTM